VVAVLVVGVDVAAYPAGTHLSGPATSGSGSQLENRTAAVPPYYSDLQGVVLPATLPPERVPRGQGAPCVSGSRQDS
jgi:hypothetical protein